jgi:hypothetical protein
MILVRRRGRLARAPWPTGVAARTGSQAFYKVVNILRKKLSSYGDR